MRSCVLGITCCAALACLLSNISQAALPSPGLTGLGPQSFNAFDVNVDGSVVVGRASNGQAMRWTAAGGVQSLGLTGGLNSQALAVSGDGSVVAGTADDSAAVTGAMRWTAADGMQPLGKLSGGNNFSLAQGISRDGNVIIGQSGSTAGNQAFRWTAAGGLVGLSDLPGGSFSSNAYGTNADGSIIVGSGTSSLGETPMRWTLAGGMQEIPRPTSGTLDPRIAQAVTPDGFTIVGNARRLGNVEGFVWTQSSGFIGIGDVAGGSVNSSANDVSDDGLTVVGQTNSGITEAAVWDAQHGLRTLRAILNAQGVSTTGWQLTGALAISGDGTAIVGQGIHNGVAEAFVAIVVPEPSSFAIMTAGASLILHRGRQRRRRRR